MIGLSKFVKVVFSKQNLLFTNLSVSVGLSGLGDFLIQQRDIGTSATHR